MEEYNNIILYYKLKELLKYDNNNVLHPIIKSMEFKYRNKEYENQNWDLQECGVCKKIKNKEEFYRKRYQDQYEYHGTCNDCYDTQSTKGYLKTILKQDIPTPKNDISIRFSKLTERNQYRWGKNKEYSNLANDYSDHICSKCKYQDCYNYEDYVNSKCEFKKRFKFLEDIDKEATQELLNIDLLCNKIINDNPEIVELKKITMQLNRKIKEKKNNNK